MTEEGELSRESSLPSKKRSLRAELPHRESGDPILGSVVMMGEGMEPSRMQESARPERAEGPQPRQMAGLLQPLTLADTIEAVAARKRPCPTTAGSSLSELSWKRPCPTLLR
jgi:hypothetical protein